MLISSAKQKGRNLQNRIAKDLAQITGLRYGSPNDDLADLRGRLMGTPGEDIVRSLRAREVVPFYVECKNSESWSFGSRMFRDGLGQLIRWYIGTADRALKTKDVSENIPIVVAAKAHFPPVVVIEDRRETLSPRWKVDNDIVIQVPLSRFIGDHEVSRRTVNILAWGDFLRLWYGDRK